MKSKENYFLKSFLISKVKTKVKLDEGKGGRNLLNNNSRIFEKSEDL